jgi:exosortase
LNRETSISPNSIAYPRLREGFASLSWSDWFLYAGALALAIPTLLAVAEVSWSTEQGGHGPLVLATGIWLIVRLWHRSVPLRKPGHYTIGLTCVMVCLALYVVTRITGIIEIEGFAMYGALIGAVYLLWGPTILKHFWFPVVYIALAFPPPETLVAAVTQPIKIWISSAAVDLLYAFGYPIASSGVTIQIAQYELLMAAACAGLNSIISLTAIGLFYIYILHNANYRYAALLLFAILPAAIFANFARVIILILVTYHFGDAAAQGFIHNFAGVTMFALSLLAIFAIDRLATPLRRRLERRPVNV